MSRWKVTRVHSDLYDKGGALLATIAFAPFKMLLGRPPTREEPEKTYTIENEDTGQVRQVRCRDSYELGKYISEGEFLDDEPTAKVDAPSPPSNPKREEAKPKRAIAKEAPPQQASDNDPSSEGGISGIIVLIVVLTIIVGVLHVAFFTASVWVGGCALGAVLGWLLGGLRLSRNPTPQLTEVSIYGNDKGRPEISDENFSLHYPLLWGRSVIFGAVLAWSGSTAWLIGRSLIQPQGWEPFGLAAAGVAGAVGGTMLGLKLARRRLAQVAARAQGLRGGGLPILPSFAGLVFLFCLIAVAENLAAPRARSVAASPPMAVLQPAVVPSGVDRLRPPISGASAHLVPPSPPAQQQQPLESTRNSSAADRPELPAVEPSFQGERFSVTRTQLLAPEDVRSWSAADIRYAINEMFARHGAEFPKAEIRRVFEAFSWYRPMPGVSFDEIENQRFSTLEKANLTFLGALREGARAAAQRQPQTNSALSPPPAANQDPSSLSAAIRPGANARIVTTRDLKKLLGQPVKDTWFSGEFVISSVEGNTIVMYPMWGGGFVRGSSTEVRATFRKGVPRFPGRERLPMDPEDSTLTMSIKPGAPLRIKSIARAINARGAEIVVVRAEQ